jgi:hypothetical protein
MVRNSSLCAKVVKLREVRARSRRMRWAKTDGGKLPFSCSCASSAHSRLVMP